MKCRVAVLALFLFAFCAVTPSALADVTTSPDISKGTVVKLQQDGIPYYVYLPASAQTSHPLVPLLAIHGYGEDALGFAGRIMPKADWYGWLLVVPDLPSGDWKDLQVIRSDTHRNLPWLHRLVHSLSDVVGTPVDSRVLVYGFSLGAQTGHRFALAYPEDVRAAAVMSAGTYTLPVPEEASDGMPLTFPHGVADYDQYSGRLFNVNAVRTSHFWVGVGEADAVPGDVPREFDFCQGDSRRERALHFVQTLWSQGIPTEFQTFQNQAHYETPVSLDAATGFLFRVTQTDPVPLIQADPASQ